jgi:hypothetical protein
MAAPELAPTKCEKCQSGNIKKSFCQGVARAGDSMVTSVAGAGFVCRQVGEHFHYKCKSCGYTKYR